MSQAIAQSATSQSIRDASSTIVVKLLRELLDFDQRLRKLSSLNASESGKAGDASYLVAAYRKELHQRSVLLKTLPQVPEPLLSPWIH